MIEGIRQATNGKLSIETSGLQSLISPITKEEFEKEYWEAKPLVLHREDRHFYSHLFTIDAVDQVLDLNRPKGQSLRVVKNQVPLISSKYEKPDGSLNLNQLFVAYADGHTIVINEIDRYWKPIKTFCRSISRELSHSSVANMYLTPKNQKALAAHHDAHDVYVLQIHGKKHWKIYDSKVETPLLNSHQPIFKNGELTGEKEITLNAGDFMYMPRGIPHEAYTTDESSLHLTIGVYPPQWIDLITEAIKVQAYNNVDLRKSLPMGYLNDPALQIEMKNRVDSLIETLAKNKNTEAAIMMLSEEFRGKQLLPGDGHFGQLDQLENITLDTVLEKRENAKSSVQLIGPHVRIVFPGNTIKGPRGIAEAFQFITDKTSFQVKDIPIQRDEHKLTLSKRLIRGGLLKIKNTQF